MQVWLKSALLCGRKLTLFLFDRMHRLPAFNLQSFCCCCCCFSLILSNVLVIAWIFVTFHPYIHSSCLLDIQPTDWNKQPPTQTGLRITHAHTLWLLSVCLSAPGWERKNSEVLPALRIHLCSLQLCCVLMVEHEDSPVLQHWKVDHQRGAGGESTGENTKKF